MNEKVKIGALIWPQFTEWSSMRSMAVTADQVKNDSLVLGKPWPNKISPVGIEIDEKRHLIYTVTKENNALYIADIAKVNPIDSINLGHEGYTCILSPDNSILYISNFIAIPPRI